MNMKKKALSILLCLALAGTLTAGGDKGAKPETAETKAEEKQEVAAGEVPQDYTYYFSFDEENPDVYPTVVDNGAFVKDESKENVFIPGVKGKALYSDGIGGHKVNIKGVGSSYTVAFWLYNGRVAQLHQPVVQYGPDIYGNKDEGFQHWVNFTYEPWNQLDTSVNVFPCVWSHYSDYITGAHNPVVDTLVRQWVHVAMTVDPADTDPATGNVLAKVYLNGELMSADDNLCNLAPDTMADTEGFEFLLGQNYWDSVFKGAYDELYVYNYALSAEQVKGLYADGDTSVAYEEPERVITVVKDEKAQESLGTLDLKADLRGAYTSSVEIKDGETYKIKLKNWSDGADTKNNYAIAFGNAAVDAEDYKEYALLYADASGEAWFENADYNYTWGNWTNCSQSPMVAADVTLTITREDKTLTVVANNVAYNMSSQDMTAVAKMSIGAEDPLFFAITNQNSYVDILSVKNATISGNAGLTVGTSDMTSGFWTEFSPIWKVPEGESRTIGFTNYSDGVENWDNFVVVLQNTETGHANIDGNPEGIWPVADYKEYVVVRADNFGWGDSYEGTVAECDWNWDTFKDDINGAHIELTVTNNGSTADIAFVARTTAGKEYHQSYKNIAIDGDLYYTLTLEKAYLQFDGTVVGSTSRDAGFWTEFSDIWAVPAGTSKSVSFTNYTDGAENWDNFVAILQNTPGGHANIEGNPEGIAPVADYKEYVVVRADNFGWGDSYEGTTAECDWNWDTFKEDMDGALIDLTVTNNGSTADIEFTATTVNKDIYHQSYKGIAVDGDVYLTLTLEKAYLVINSTTVGAVDNSMGFWTQFSDVQAVPEGETVYQSFTNYTDGVENWNNFVVILQNTPTGHANAEGNPEGITPVEGYAEYVVVRADNFGWGDGYASVTPESNWNWDTFKEDMDGAHITLAVTNNGATADIRFTATTKSGVFYQNYDGITTGGDLYFCIGGEKAHMNLD